jgi:putative NADH-flavin reductase
MYAVTGITGRVGGVVARALLDTGQSVRAVVRDAAKGVAWKERGCEVALADMKDAKALTAAFTGRERGVRADPVELSLLSCRKAGKARICASDREPSGKSRLSTHSPMK